MNLLEMAKSAPVVQPYDVGLEMYNQCMQAARCAKSYPEVEGIWLISEYENDRSDDKQYVQILLAAKEFTPQYGLKTEESLKRHLALGAGIWDAFVSPGIEVMISDYYQDVEPAPGEYVESLISDYIRNQQIRALFVR